MSELLAAFLSTTEAFNSYGSGEKVTKIQGSYFGE